jgi:3-hydroxyacyl-CoA dehydrogenase
VIDSTLPGFLEADGSLREQLRRLLPEPVFVGSRAVRHRVRDALAEEARMILDERVVATMEDIDRCMILGANFPAGGLTALLVGQG